MPFIGTNGIVPDVIYSPDICGSPTSPVPQEDHGRSRGDTMPVFSDVALDASAAYRLRQYNAHSELEDLRLWE